MAESVDTPTRRLRALRAELDATLARMIELQREPSKTSAHLVRLGNRIEREQPQTSGTQ